MESLKAGATTSPCQKNYVDSVRKKLTLFSDSQIL